MTRHLVKKALYSAEVSRDVGRSSFMKAWNEGHEKNWIMESLQREKNSMFLGRMALSSSTNLKSDDRLIFELGETH